MVFVSEVLLQWFPHLAEDPAHMDILKAIAFRRHEMCILCDSSYGREILDWCEPRDDYSFYEQMQRGPVTEPTAWLGVSSYQTK